MALRLARRLVLAGAVTVAAAAVLSAPAGAAVTFSPVVKYQTIPGGGPWNVHLADVDTDGHLDVVVPQLFADRVGVFLGAPDGTLGARKDSLAPFSAPFDLAVGDLDGDGTPDLATGAVDDISAGEVSLLLGRGDGTFDMTYQHFVGYFTAGVAIADFDRDGKPDVASASFYGVKNIHDRVAFLRGRGDGTVEDPTYTSVNGFLDSLSTADFNRDGLPDLAVEAEPVQVDNGGLYLLLGRGDGTFAPPVEYLGDQQPASLRVADVDGDGRTDVVATALDHGVRRLVVLPGKGDKKGRLGHPVVSKDVTDLRALSVGDVSGDGVPDVVGTRYLGADVQVAEGKRKKRQFAAPQAIPAGFEESRATALGDLNGDRRLDIVASEVFAGEVAVLLNATPRRPPKH